MSARPVVMLLVLLMSFAASEVVAQTATGSSSSLLYFRQRENSASPEIRARLARLRQLKIMNHWRFQPMYTDVMDLKLEQITGFKAPSNFKQVIAAQNAKAAAKLAALGWRAPAPTALVNIGLPQFDWRTLHMVTEVKNQNPCGSCWVFAAHGAFEGAWAVASGGQLLSTSEQNTLDCNGESDCGGGHLDEAFNYIQDTGTADGAVYPYPMPGQQRPCQVPPLPQPYHIATWGYVEDDDEVPSVVKLKTALCAHGPLAVCIYSTDALQSYAESNDEVFDEHDTGHIWQRTNHCVTLIGWDDSKHAWLVKNSWGPNWGGPCGLGSTGGYAWIDYDSNNIGYGAAWVLPQVVAHEGSRIESWTIPMPIINRPGPVVYDGIQAAPRIEFRPGDEVVLQAGGCAQTGGSGDTWKRYVNPSGDDASRMYFGTVDIAGVTNGEVPIRDTGGSYDETHRDVYTVHFADRVPSGISPGRCYLALGYRDEDYSDNGYDNHDDGTEDQCRGVGNAYVRITVTHHIGEEGGPAETDPVEAKYESGGIAVLLGSPSEPEKVAPDGTGKFRYYQRGCIYWAPGSGAHEVHGAILSKWATLKWEKSFLGYPTTDESPTPDGAGRFNHFEHGSIYWTPATGAHEIHGAIREKWAQLGWERSTLGYPVSDEEPSGQAGGRISRFEHGSIVWDSVRGARVQ